MALTRFLFSVGWISCVYVVVCEEYENVLQEQDPGYGKEWIYFPDDEGNPMFVNLSGPPVAENRMGDVSQYVHFLLYTSDNPDEYDEIFLDDDEDSDANEVDSSSASISEYFDPEKPLKLVTHGWMSSGSSSTVINIKDAYLRSADVNVIIVDWKDIAGNYLYPIAAFHTKDVGQEVAKLLDRLTSQHSVRGSQMHLIGHSLGAHVMGYGGAYTKYENVSRITGLDAARPLFELPPLGPEKTLDRSDADFVDAIHTCGGVLGYSSSLAHADFYPNNGHPCQPGCDGPQHWLEACSHARAHEFFVESIETDTSFVSYPCDSWESFNDGKCRDNPVIMGDPLSPEARGKFYLHTNRDGPYAKGAQFDTEEDNGTEEDNDTGDDDDDTGETREIKVDHEGDEDYDENDS